MLKHRTLAKNLLFMVLGTGLLSPFTPSAAAEDLAQEPVMTPISSAAAEEIVKEPVAAPVPPPKSNNEDQALAKRSLDYFRAACDPALIGEKSSGFSFFSNKNTPIYTKCIDDLTRFERTYAGKPWVAEGLWRASELERARKNLPGEVLALAKVLYLYDDATLRVKAENRLTRMAADELKAERKGLKVLAVAPTGGDIPQRNVQMLQQLALFEGKEFLPLLRRECDTFLERYPATAAAETILALREESLFREKEFSTYALGLRLLITLYPQSPERINRLTLLGMVQSKELRDHKTAVATYDQLLRDYPKTSEAEAAYLESAKICDEELKDYPRAIELLSALVRDFPRTQKAQTALDYQAKIYAKKMKDPLAAINSYRQLVAMFPGKGAIVALGEAATLARMTLQDYDEQITLQEELIQSYPESPEAAQALFDIAQTEEDQLKNVEKALQSYQRFVDLYPTNPLAERARKRLEKGKVK